MGGQVGGAPGAFGGAIGRPVLKTGAIVADDAPVKLQAPGSGLTKTARRLWTYGRDEQPWAGTAPPAAWYRFSTDRKAERPRDHLKGFRGWMHADGYAGFEELYRSGRVHERSPAWPTSGASSSMGINPGAPPRPHTNGVCNP